MKKTLNYSILIIALATIFSCSEKINKKTIKNGNISIMNGIQNPQFTPGQLMLDNNGVHINAHGGGIMHYNSKYYWYGQHMVEGKAGNKAQVGVHVYSSKDLYTWEDEGIALKVI